MHISMPVFLVTYSARSARTLRCVKKLWIHWVMIFLSSFGVFLSSQDDFRMYMFLTRSYSFKHSSPHACSSGRARFSSIMSNLCFSHQVRLSSGE